MKITDNEKREVLKLIETRKPLAEEYNLRLSILHRLSSGKSTINPDKLLYVLF